MNSCSMKTILFFAISLTICQKSYSYSNIVKVHANISTHYSSSGEHREAANDKYSNGGERHEVAKEAMSTESSIQNSTNDDRIAGGQYAREKQFPFVAVVHRLAGRGMIAQCGGTVLSSRWVLTAGHCIAEYPRKFFLVFGIIDKSSIQYDYNLGPGVSMITTRSYLHPRYKKSINDIGLLYMPRDIPFSSKIQPIRIASKNDMYTSYNGETATVIGWGKDHTDGSTTQALKYARLTVISQRECRLYWDVDERNVCTAFGAGQNACQGDSGGPLVIRDWNGHYLQIGIVSYGDAYCPSDRPGVFTKVAAFGSWIESITKLRN